jgi:predicted DNA-binding transcriptional regulator AlpA
MKIEIDGVEYLNPEDVIKLTGLNRTYFFALVNQGEFPKPLKLEFRTLWKLSEIEEYLKKTKEEE